MKLDDRELDIAVVSSLGFFVAEHKRMGVAMRKRFERHWSTLWRCHASLSDVRYAENELERLGFIEIYKSEVANILAEQGHTSTTALLRADATTRARAIVLAMKGALNARP